MRVLLTGATGFLGSYVADELLTSGHSVAALIRQGSNPWRLRPILDRLAVIEGSLANLRKIEPALSAFKPEAVAHLAWEGVAGAVRNDPAQAQNIVHTVALAELAADVGARVWIGAGSQAEYGAYDRPINEDDATHPTTLYGWAKLAAGKMAQQICVAREIRFAWLRVFSTYGPMDAEHWLIPSTIRSLQGGERVPLTAGEQRWGFLHARDAATAFRTALLHPDARGVLNVGSPEAPRLRNTLEELRDFVNPQADLGFGDIAYRPDQVMVLQADVTRLSRLGWRPKVSLAEGLRETTAWYAQRS
jgi:UDP-glucose 4-epimerase